MTATERLTDGPPPRSGAQDAILQVQHLVKYFPIRAGLLRGHTGDVHAVDDVSFNVSAGETLAIVGESGCGKSTTARLLARLIEPTSGRIVFDGKELLNVHGKELRELRRQIQIVFQDSFASLDPRMTAHGIVAEPLRAHHLYSKQRVAELFELVQLNARHVDRRPSEYSGGQRQRISLARALALRPRMLILDEPTSALDVSIQAQIVNLLKELQAELSVAYVLISHDLSVVRQVAHYVAVMYLGKIVESGDCESVYNHPRHPYTRALMSAVPIPDPTQRGRARIILTGDLPSAIDPPSGCRFRTRCWKAQDVCTTSEPALGSDDGSGHHYACHFPEPGPADRADHQVEHEMPASPWSSNATSDSFLNTHATKTS